MEEDISPWRQTEHDDAQHHHQSSNNPSNTKAIRSVPYFDLTATAFLSTRKVPLGLHIAVPELSRSKSLGMGLPKLSYKP